MNLYSRPAAIAAFVLSTFGLPGHAQQATPTSLPLKPVKLMEVSSAQQTFSRIFYGTVVARQTVDLAFQVGGQIVDFPLIEGDLVPEGSMVAQLDQEPFSLALEQATLQIDQADRTLERLNKLSGNTVSQVTIDDAETQSRLADIAFRQAENNLDNATLWAPFNALVAARHVGNFNTIGAGSPVVRLHDMSDLRVEIDVPEILFQTASSSKNVLIQARFPGVDQLYPLAIREFNAEAAKAGQTYRLTLGMAPREELRVLPGSSVDVLVTAMNNETGIELPVSAVTMDPNGEPQVMRFVPQGDGTGQIVATAVEIEPTPNGKVFLRSGLSHGDTIVAAGAAAVSDGEVVRAFTGFAN